MCLHNKKEKSEHKITEETGKIIKDGKKTAIRNKAMKMITLLVEKGSG